MRRSLQIMSLSSDNEPKFGDLDLDPLGDLVDVADSLYTT